MDREKLADNLRRVLKKYDIGVRHTIVSRFRRSLRKIDDDKFAFILDRVQHLEDITTPEEREKTESALRDLYPGDAGETLVKVYHDILASPTLSKAIADVKAALLAE